MPEGQTPRHFRDLTADRFGRLVVLYRDETKKNRHAYWVCECDCGGFRTVRSDALVGSRTRSCGCMQVERVEKLVARVRSGEIRRPPVHGCYRTAEYTAWRKARSNYPDEVPNFIQFYRTIGPKPASPKTKLCHMPQGGFMWKPLQAHSSTAQTQIG